MELLKFSVIGCMFLLMANFAQAGDDSGIYIGASVGSANVDASDDEFDFDDDDLGYKIFVGYNFGIIPLIDLGIEGSYVDFGSQDGKTSGNEIETTAWDAFGVFGLTFGPFGIFAKAGVAEWNIDVDTNNGSFSESGNDPVYGIGAKFQIASFAIRAEYEIFEFDNVDMDYYSVGAAYTF
jgi:opacity protein-like surface antigen